jgi:hypothetical protein
MMLDRRSFLSTTLGAAAAAAVAIFLSLSSTVEAQTPLPAPLSTQPITSGIDKNCVAFKIDGWNRCDAVEIGGSMASPHPTEDHVVIKLNQSWRSTWR